MWPLTNFEFFCYSRTFLKIVKVLVIILLTFDLTKLLPTKSNCRLHIFENWKVRVKKRRFQMKFVTDGKLQGRFSAKCLNLLTNWTFANFDPGQKLIRKYRWIIHIELFLIFFRFSDFEPRKFFVTCKYCNQFMWELKIWHVFEIFSKFFITHSIGSNR